MRKNTRAVEVGDLPEDALFTVTDHPQDREVWRVQRQVESFTEIQRVGDRYDTLAMSGLLVFRVPSVRRAAQDGMCYQEEDNNA